MIVDQGFIFYREFYSIINKLTDDEQIKVYNAVFDYAFRNKKPKNLNVKLADIFCKIMPKIQVVNYEI